jgi:hypothetical protein
MDDFDDIVRLLREERPEASELELDRIKRRVMSRTPRKGQPMRSRLAILAMLVVGMLMSGTGAGLAVQGFGNAGDDASQAQYPPKDKSDVLGEEDAGGNLPDNEEAVENAVQEDAQVAQQVQAGDSLPFTGFVAIPVLVGGVALLAGGLVLRRRSS